MMHIDSYRVCPPDVEVLYYYDTEPSATLMVAPYTTWATHCTDRYNGEIDVEYWNTDRTDVEQKVFHFELDAWFYHICQWQANEVMQDFVSSCLSDPERSGAHFFA